MKLRIVCLLSLLLIWSCLCEVKAAGLATIKKVFVFYLDSRGRYAPSPSLFDRDAYQAWLRDHPEHQFGICFVVQWARAIAGQHLQLVIELNTEKYPKQTPIIIRTAVPDRRKSGWMRVALDGQDYKDAGKVLAWRVTLREGDQVLAEKMSFLW